MGRANPKHTAKRVSRDCWSLCSAFSVQCLCEYAGTVSPIYSIQKYTMLLHLVVSWTIVDKVQYWKLLLTPDARNV